MVGERAIVIAGDALDLALLRGLLWGSSGRLGLAGKRNGRQPRDEHGKRSHLRHPLFVEERKEACGQRSIISSVILATSAWR